MTDWGVHLIDPMHQAMGEPMPKSIVALGSKFYVDDDTETPDTLQATFQYDKFLSTYESRTVNPDADVRAKLRDLVPRDEGYAGREPGRRLGLCQRREGTHEEVGGR